MKNILVKTKDWVWCAVAAIIVGAWPFDLFAPFLAFTATHDHWVRPMIVISLFSIVYLFRIGSLKSDLSYKDREIKYLRNLLSYARRANTRGGSIFAYGRALRIIEKELNHHTSENDPKRDVLLSVNSLIKNENSRVLESLDEVIKDSKYVAFIDTRDVGEGENYALEEWLPPSDAYDLLVHKKRKP